MKKIFKMIPAATPGPLYTRESQLFLKSQHVETCQAAFGRLPNEQKTFVDPRVDSLETILFVPQANKVVVLMNPLVTRPLLILVSGHNSPIRLAHFCKQRRPIINTIRLYLFERTLKISPAP